MAPTAHGVVGASHYAGTVALAVQSKPKVGGAYEFTSQTVATYTEGEPVRPRLQVIWLLAMPHQDHHKEEIMNELVVMLSLVFVRIILPVGLLLGVGEMSRRAQHPGLRGS
jgi:hypothetical protein